MKSSTLFEAKNFLFEFKLQEWSYQGNNDDFLDITDNNGKVHTPALQSLLPMMNELHGINIHPS